jgi:hypothetical protein
MDAEREAMSGNAQVKATTPQHEVSQFLTASIGVEKPLLEKPLLARPFGVSGLDVEVHAVTSSL